MDLSICILTYNQPTLLHECVEACVSEIGRSRVTGEIIVVDNASADRYPKQVADRFPMVHVIRKEQNLGFSAANNEAVRISRGRCVLILNDDALLQDGALGIMLDSLGSDPRIGAVGPNLVNPDGSLQLGFTNRRFPNLRGILCQTLTLEDLLMQNALTRDMLTLGCDPSRSGETDHLAGACLLLRREALEAVGCFDETFRFWFEDVDLCWRLKEAHWGVVYLANARVTHYGSATFKKRAQAERDVIYFRSLMCFWNKHRGYSSFQLMRITVAGALLLRTWAGALRRFSQGNLSARERREWMRARISVVRLLLGKVSGAALGPWSDIWEPHELRSGPPPATRQG
jgi:N-acetylglucosaminyl-diphospho-decaprenol L-rhamnosyltransferase